MCNVCERFAEEHPGGTELEISILFADIRGSTPLAATMNPYEFSRVINRFYQTTTNVIFEHGGMIATLAGDGLAAFFAPAFTEDHNYARAAVMAGRAILASTGHGGTEEPWVPVGVGIHTGETYIGAVGEPGKSIDITVLGDSVNVASRLSGQAQAGEMIVSEATVRSGGLEVTGHESRTLTLKGKEEPMHVWVYRA
jgi:adenylate cyclase